MKYNVTDDNEIERIVFEVDETMDGRINWGEFQLAYLRNINDKTGLEPYGLHNIITFCMCVLFVCLFVLFTLFVMALIVG